MICNYIYTYKHMNIIYLRKKATQPATQKPIQIRKINKSL